MTSNKIARVIRLRDELLGIPEGQYPHRTWSDIEAWITKITPIIRQDWPDFLEDFREAAAGPSGPGAFFVDMDTLRPTEREHRRLWQESNEKAERIRQRIISFTDGLLELGMQEPSRTVIDEVVFLCKRFPVYAKEMQSRARGRPPLEIADEYDVQYCLKALLRLHFDDVRAETWTPNYAGTSSREDFLLKREGIVIEVKKTRNSLCSGSQLADQLIIDTRRYAEDPNCKTLICFVYDPDGLIDNPKGIENDLSEKYGEVSVLVVISPTGM